jgi:hypothetical protein
LRRWKPWAMAPISLFMVAHCGRCKRRKVVEYELPEEVKRLLLLYRWKTGVRLPCVDELAERGGIRYRPENLEATTWADLPTKRPGRRRG